MRARPDEWVASYVPGELIPCAFVWHDPGITPCCKSRRRGWRGSAKPFLKEVPCSLFRLLRSDGGGDARRLEITHSTSTLWSLQHSRNGGGWHDRRRPGDQL